MNQASELQKLSSRNRELEAEVKILQSENRLMKSKLGPAAWRIDGRKAEEFVQQLIGGVIQKASAPFDLILPSRTTFEIKYSNLNRVTPIQKTHRWNWPHILGSNRAKTFDHLLLLGPPDPQYRDNYCDPEAPLVIFDIPFREVSELLEPTGTIWTSTNPFTFRRTTHRNLFCYYQISRKQLVQRYAPVEGGAPGS